MENLWLRKLPFIPRQGVMNLHRDDGPYLHLANLKMLGQNYCETDDNDIPINCMFSARIVRNFNTNNDQDYQLSYGNLVDFEAVGFYHTYTNETIAYSERAQTLPQLLQLGAASLTVTTTVLAL